MNHTSTVSGHYRDKMSARDIPRQTVNIVMYAQYDAKDVLEEYVAKYWVEGRKLTTNISAKRLEDLARAIVNDVVTIENIIKPWYDFQLIDGPLPKEKAPEGFVRYTAKPDGAVKELISLLQEKKEELADQKLESYLKQQQTHKTHYPKRPPFAYRRF
jgi:hypothetical protein